ncbi:Heme NO binding protein [Gammaproteobacteria bacterium MOLA455]|nr:Heme NO binding protein [Gammaproteobacteria bacterium MOLA455]
MKGFVLAAVVNHLEKHYGDQFSSELLQSMDRSLGSIYLSMDDFPDDTLSILLSNSAILLGVSTKKLAKIVGVLLFSEMFAINEKWISQNTNAFDLLRTHDMALNKIVSMAFPGFIAPSISCTNISPDILELDYRSTFLPGDVVEGLISAMFIHYGESFHIERSASDPEIDYNEKIILRRTPRAIS